MDDAIEIPETPVRLGEETFVARRDADDPNRYQVFGSGMAPWGYLDVHFCDEQCPTDYKGRGHYYRTQIRVTNAAGRRIGCVSRYTNALASLLWDASTTIPLD